MFPQISHKMITGMWEMEDIYNLRAEPEESILALEGNMRFREEAERVTIGERLWDPWAVPHFCSGVCDIHCCNP